jgi:radical SAM-linked protein
MAYSAGFSPHPKISYAGAAPTGVASEAEYLEISVTSECDLVDLRRALDAALPEGLDILAVVEAADGSLAERLQASVWEASLVGVDLPAAARAVERFLDAPRVEVQRLTKNGLRTFDARAAVLALAARFDPVEAGGCVILQMVVRHVTPAVRPDDVLTGLRLVADLVPLTPPAVTRQAQGPYDAETGSVSDPLVSRPPVTSAGGKTE